jgi:shikimate dehydrogenase
LEHSLSPRLHGAALRAAGVEGEYRLYAAPPMPQGAAELEALLGRMRAGDLHGLNVTIPHKQAVLPYLDDLTPTARAIGAANTLFLQDGRLLGDNTDAPGFLADLGGWRGAGCCRTVLTAGWCGAVVCGGGWRWQVRLAARRLEQAQALQGSFAAYGTLHVCVLEAGALAVLDMQVDLLVNTTPLGMWPHVDASPWPAGLALPRGACIYDLVYNPAQTRLVQAGRAAGLPAANGLGMLVEQAALAELARGWVQRAAMYVTTSHDRSTHTKRRTNSAG